MDNSKDNDLKKDTTKYVNVSPDMQFYNLLESYPYDIAGALCEYIDNALEAYFNAKRNNIPNLSDILKIDIFANNNSITIRDFGVGILVKDIQRAMKPGYSPDKKSLSEFGIGMKAASVWFGRKWSLQSHSLVDRNSFSLTFDLDKLLKDGHDQVILDEIKLKVPGVKIIISNLNKDFDRFQAERAWEDIDEKYQLFTSRENPSLELTLTHENKDDTPKIKKFPKKDFSQLTVSNNPLIFPLCKFKNNKLYVIGDSITWKQDIEFYFEDKLVTGFISLGKESSQTSNPGVRLFRYGRLIQGTENEPYRPTKLLGSANKAAPSRFYAELHLDGQAISNSKGEFVFDELAFLEKLKKQQYVNEYISQAENYRKRKVDTGDYETLSSLKEFEKKTGVISAKIPGKKKPKPKIKNQIKPLSPISVLTQQRDNIPESYILLGKFIDEAIRLYHEDRRWPFTLTYRVILEVSIIEKVKRTDNKLYDAVKDKSILGLYKYLQGHSNIIPEKYRTLKKVLGQNNQSSYPYIGVLNLAAHGHNILSKSEVDELLGNTQQLLEWSFDHEVE